MLYIVTWPSFNAIANAIAVGRALRVWVSGSSVSERLPCRMYLRSSTSTSGKIAFQCGFVSNDGAEKGIMLWSIPFVVLPAATIQAMESMSEISRQVSYVFLRGFLTGISFPGNSFPKR